MRLDIYHHADQRVVDKLDQLLALGEINMDNIDRLIEDVAKQKTAIESMKTFIAGMKHAVAEALAGAKLSAEHEARLASIFPDLEGNTDAIAAAVTTSPDETPVPVEPVPEPASEPVPDLASQDPVGFPKP